jgi:GST-like protein
LQAVSFHRGAPLNDLAAFPVTRKWPAKEANRLQLYSLPTPNGV